METVLLALENGIIHSELMKREYYFINAARVGNFT